MFNFLFKKGVRIKSHDKSLVYRVICIEVAIVALIVATLFYGYSFLTINWNEVDLKALIAIDIPVLIIYLLTVATLSTTLSLFVYKKFPDKYKQLVHRQKIARMVLENRWYEVGKRKNTSFFKDLSSNDKEVITNFPKIYYRLCNGLIHIQVEIILGKYQDQLLNLEKKIESGLYCELVDKELFDSYIEYTLLYDTIANRINIDKVKANTGSLKLMKNVIWEYDKLPHMLVAGGTGGGKTYFILTIIKALSDTNSRLYILDPKNSDLADLATILPNVYYKKEDMLNCLNQFYNNMMERNQIMKLMDGYKTGENYSYLGLSANFLIFDEYVAFMDSLGRESSEVMSKLKQIVMLGRQSGFFLILACQRPDAKYLGDGIRDQFNMRIALGRMSELGYNMMFGETNKAFFLKQIKGRGYIDVGNNVISEFYTPLVPKGYDFLKEIKCSINDEINLD